MMAAYRVQFLSTPPSPFTTVLYRVFLIAAATFAAWRTIVVDWSVWFAPVAWLADIFGLASTALFLSVIRYRTVPVPPATAGDLAVDALIPTVNEPLDVLEPAV